MSQMAVMKTMKKRLYLWVIYLFGAMFLVTYGVARGVFGPQGLAISGFVLFAGLMIAFVLIFRKSKKEALAVAPPPGTPSEKVTHE